MLRMLRADRTTDRPAMGICSVNHHRWVRVDWSGMAAEEGQMDDGSGT